MSTTLQFEFRSGAAKRRSDLGPARLLLLGDFGGRGPRGLRHATPLLRQPVIPVDIDSLDDAVAQCEPAIETTLSDGTALNLVFNDLDDFHPDRLVARHPLLSSQMALRKRLLDPAQFAAAAAELTAANVAPAAAPLASTPAAREDDASTIGRLLGGSAAKSAPGSNTAAAGVVDSFLRKTVPVDRRADALALQQPYVAEVEARAAVSLRALLHQPEFQSLESIWRGVQFLVSRLELGDELELYLLDVTQEELRADAAEVAPDSPGTALARRLRALADDAADADATWALAAGLFRVEFGDLDALQAIGRASRAADMPFVAGAGTTISGTFPDASEWQRPAATALTRWESLRASEAARSVGLVCPRFLLRLPYGAATDTIETFPFEELGGPDPAPTDLLWGEGALAATLAIARNDAAGAFDIDDLPALTYGDSGRRVLLPCAEWLIGEQVASQLADFGLMPLLGSRHRNAVRLAGWRSAGRG